MTDTDVPRPATGPLLALAAAARPDWSSTDLADTVARARTQGMPFARVLVVVAQLMADPDARPHHLLDALPDPWRQRRRPPEPETAHRGAAAARAALAHPPTTHMTEGT